MKPSVGTSRYSIANVASLDMQFATLGRSKSNPLRKTIKSLTNKILELHAGRDANVVIKSRSVDGRIGGGWRNCSNDQLVILIGIRRFILHDQINFTVLSPT